MSQPTPERNIPFDPNDTADLERIKETPSALDLPGADQIAAPTQDATGKAEETSRRRGKKPARNIADYLWREWVRPIGEAVIIALVITTFVFTTVAIQGNSDQPNVWNGERVFVPKYETWLHKLGIGNFQRGDLVVLKPPKDSPSSVKPVPIISNFFPNATYRPYFIKRIVAIAGDKVRLDKGQLFVNGIKVEETHTTTYWKSQNNWDTTSGLASSDEWYFRDEKERKANKEYTVPKGQFFVMGDNRSQGGSEDSRVFGPVKLDDFSGRAVFVWWPPMAQVKTVTGKTSDGRTVSWDKPLERDWQGKLEDTTGAQLKLRMRVLPRPDAFEKLNKQLDEMKQKAP